MGEHGVAASERRVTAIAAVLLLLLALAAWIELAGPHRPGMAPARWLLFLAGWLVMTVAMMVPASLPVLLLHRVHAARRGAGPLPTLVFLVGYLIVWTGGGLVALGMEIAAVRVVPGGLDTPAVSAVALLVAGAYQLTPLKSSCLRACRHPLTVLFELGAASGLRRDLSGGLRHGAWCLACCWSLMVVLLVVGAMNLAWMAVLTAVLLLEKNVSQGPSVARATGLALTLLGVAGLLHPELLAWLSGGMPSGSSGGGM